MICLHSWKYEIAAVALLFCHQPHCHFIFYITNHHKDDDDQVSSSYGSSLALVGTSDETEPLLTRLHASGQNHLQAHPRIHLNSKLNIYSFLFMPFFQMNWILQWYWKDCQLLQDKGWNFWTSQCFFSRIGEMLFQLGWQFENLY